MEKSSKIFVDSNFIIALFHPKDTLHKRANELSSKLSLLDLDFVSSNMVFAETVTVLSLRQGREVAKEAGKFVTDIMETETLFVDEDIHQVAWEEFQNSSSKNISFVDFTTVALMRSENIKEVLTFDETDFKKLKKHYRFRIVN